MFVLRRLFLHKGTSQKDVQIYCYDKRMFLFGTMAKFSYVPLWCQVSLMLGEIGRTLAELRTFCSLLTCILKCGVQPGPPPSYKWNMLEDGVKRLEINKRISAGYILTKLMCLSKPSFTLQKHAIWMATHLTDEVLWDNKEVVDPRWILSLATTLTFKQ